MRRNRAPTDLDANPIDRAPDLSLPAAGRSRFMNQPDCPACLGLRLRPEALAVKFDGRNIAELSSMTVRDLREFFQQSESPRRGQALGATASQIAQRLGYLADVGLDYLQLDRPASSLAAGELQRVSLDQDARLGPGEHALHPG